MRRWSTFTAPRRVATAARCGLFLLRRSYLRIRVTSTIESDGLRSGRNRGTATIRDRLGHMFATQRLGSIQYLLIMGKLRPVCWPWRERSSRPSQRAASATGGSDRTYLYPVFPGTSSGSRFGLAYKSHGTRAREHGNVWLRNRYHSLLNDLSSGTAMRNARCPHISTATTTLSASLDNLSISYHKIVF
jgi:hypothetical protein